MSLRSIFILVFLIGILGVVFWTNRLVNQEADTLSNLDQPLPMKEETAVTSTVQSAGQLPVIDPDNDPLAPVPVVINLPKSFGSPGASKEQGSATYEFPVSGPLVQ